MKLGHVLADYCYANRLSVREFARELGLAPATAHRLCKGENVDAETIGRVVAWLFASGEAKRQKPAEDVNTKGKV